MPAPCRISYEDRLFKKADRQAPRTWRLPRHLPRPQFLNPDAGETSNRLKLDRHTATLHYSLLDPCLSRKMENKAFTLTRDQLTSPTKQTCLITGGSSGIGLQTCIILHELGNNVVVIDRSPPIPSAPKEVTSSSRFLFEQCDITSWSSQRGAFESAFKKFGSIDNVFVNAGIAEYGDQFFKDDLDSSGLLKEPDRRCVDIDLQAADDTVKLAIHYIRRKEKDGKGRGGSIVMTASLAGYLASAGAPLYSAAKHGMLLHHFDRYLKQ